MNEHLAAAITGIVEALGPRRPLVWIPASTTNTWTPAPGDRIEDAARPLTAPERILSDGTRIPSRGVYEIGGAHGIMRQADGTLHHIGPAAQIARVCGTCDGRGIVSRGTGKATEWKRCTAAGCAVEESEARENVVALAYAANPSGRMG